MFVCVYCPNFPPNPHTPHPLFFSPVAKCWNVAIWNMTLSQWKGEKKVTVSEVLRFLPFHAHPHKSSACNAWTTSAALRLIRRMSTSRITLAAFVLFIPTARCLATNGTVCTQVVQRISNMKYSVGKALISGLFMGAQDCISWYWCRRSTRCRLLLIVGLSVFAICFARIRPFEN